MLRQLIRLWAGGSRCGAWGFGSAARSLVASGPCVASPIPAAVCVPVLVACLQAWWEAEKKWYAGVVEHRKQGNKGKTPYTIHFDDGDKLHGQFVQDDTIFASLYYNKEEEYPVQWLTGAGAAKPAPTQAEPAATAEPRTQRTSKPAVEGQAAGNGGSRAKRMRSSSVAADELQPPGQDKIGSHDQDAARVFNAVDGSGGSPAPARAPQDLGPRAQSASACDTRSSSGCEEW